MQNYSLRKFMVLQFCAFVLLVAIGLTGSSIDCVRQWAGGVVETDSRVLLGHSQPIRSDEWAVGTLLGIAQFNSKEYFPINNEQLGLQGKHLAVAHDTGVPVWEIATIAKPATIGYFFLDLKRALAWYWWVPLFIAFNGIFLLLCEFFPWQRFTNAVLALGLTFSYHSAAWSFWGVYEIGLCAISAFLFLRLLKTERKLYLWGLAGVLGLSLASVGLTLYYPRLIPVIWFFLLVVWAFVHQRGLYRAVFERTGYFAFALAICCGILTSWYINNADAISAMLSSSYPGQRRTYFGDMHLWDEVRGWLAPLFLKNNFNVSNMCELTSYVTLIIPFTVLLFALRRKIDVICAAIIVFVLFTYCYLYIGIPEIIGKVTFWNRTTFRAIIGIDLATIFMLAWFWSKQKSLRLSESLKFFIAFIVPVIIVVSILAYAPQPLIEGMRFNRYALISLALLICVHWCLAYHIRWSPFVYTGMMLLTMASWNPLSMAPSYFNLNHDFQMLMDADPKKTYAGRIVVATGDFILPNALAATGQKVYNPTSHYIDEVIYRDFYQVIDDGTYKKFNHMIISVTPEATSISSVGDVIYLKLNNGFDFSKFRSDYMIIRGDGGELLNNPSVKQLGVFNGFSLYKILVSKKK